jgi:hypothetical protein
VKLTERQKKCLAYLDHLMEATPAMIGQAVAAQEGRTHRGYAMIGNGVVKSLYRRGDPLITYLPDLDAWRITKTGRAALKRSEEP